MMQKIYDSDCENHAGGRSLTHKVINEGYYWLKMFDDVEGYVKKCPQYQRFSPVSNRPSTDLHTLLSPWPFMHWGLDVVGPLPRAQPQLQFSLGEKLPDYFTKWFEAVPLSGSPGNRLSSTFGRT